MSEPGHAQRPEARALRAAQPPGPCQQPGFLSHDEAIPPWDVALDARPSQPREPLEPGPFWERPQAASATWPLRWPLWQGGLCGPLPRAPLPRLPLSTFRPQDGRCPSCWLLCFRWLWGRHGTAAESRGRRLQIIGSVPDCAPSTRRAAVLQSIREAESPLICKVPARVETGPLLWQHRTSGHIPGLLLPWLCRKLGCMRSRPPVRRQFPGAGEPWADKPWAGKPGTADFVDEPWVGKTWAAGLLVRPARGSRAPTGLAWPFGLRPAPADGAHLARGRGRRTVSNQFKVWWLGAWGRAVTIEHSRRCG